jgi:uncharacterized protein (DUF2141 family)
MIAVEPNLPVAGFVEPMFGLPLAKHASKKQRVLSRLLLGLGLVGTLSMLPCQAEAEGTVLRVPVSKLRSAKGALYVGVYNRNGWLRAGKHTTYQKVKAVKGTIRVTFEGLRPGRYAVAAFHDENGNGKVDFNFLGFPSEGYGFSRTTPFGKPSFDDTAFELKDQRDMPIHLKY